MEIIAQSKYIRTTPRKLKLVVDAIKGLSIDDAQIHLQFLPKKATKSVTLVLNQALSNALNNFNLAKENLKIKKIVIGKGPIMKRWRAGARGRFKPFTKRTSHLTIVLEETTKPNLKKSKKKIKKQ